ncbi:hypothetical protein [Variovorax sp. DAIF25]|uniref:hypothetical protein n=1 Tax=Variovorax sp. DAIF25 TaxID=3080983 RepID=UPI003D6A09FA
MKVNANQFLYFIDLLHELKKAMGEGHTVVAFAHSWGGDSCYGDRDGPRLDIEFEARITRINGEAVPRITQSKKATKKETKQ